MGKYQYILEQEFDKKITIGKDMLSPQMKSILTRVSNKIRFYFLEIAYKLKSILYINKTFRNLGIATMNSLEDIFVSEDIKEMFLFDVKRLLIKIDLGEIKTPEEYRLEYNNILDKYGYRRYHIYGSDKR